MMIDIKLDPEVQEIIDDFEDGKFESVITPALKWVNRVTLLLQ